MLNFNIYKVNEKIQNVRLIFNIIPKIIVILLNIIRKSNLIY